MLELEMTLKCPKCVTSHYLVLFKILLCCWCYCWVSFGLWMELWAGWVARFLVDGLPVGQDSQYDADWLTHLSPCTRLAWVCLCTRVLTAREKVSSQVSLTHMLSLACHSTVHGEAQSYPGTVDQGHHWRKFCTSPILIRNSVHCPQDFSMSINSKHGDHTAWGRPYG